MTPDSGRRPPLRVAGEETPTTSDRLFREFLELQETEGHAIAAERFLREHPEEAERLRGVIETAGALAVPTDSDGSGKEILDERLLLPLQGRYRIERFLARGGMGDVYLATDTRIDALVAVKVFSRASDSDLRSRFLREARVGGRLAHRQRGTVRIYDLDVLADGTPYLVMEYVEGRSLAAVLGEGALAPRVVAYLVGRLADTLGAIHGDGVVHCDLKPSNVLVQPRADGCFEPVLIDFGVARVRGPLQVGPETRDGEFRGTMSYASPESLDGQAGAASDQFSLAVLAYEALTGRRPFEAAGMAALVDEIRAREPPRADAVNPAVPEVMAQAIAVAMSKRPEERFTSITDFGRAIEGGVVVVPARARRSRSFVAVGTAAALVAIAGTGLVAWRLSSARGAATSARSAAASPPSLLPSSTTQVPASPSLRQVDVGAAPLTAPGAIGPLAMPIDAANRALPAVDRPGRPAAARSETAVRRVVAPARGARNATPRAAWVPEVIPAAVVTPAAGIRGAVAVPVPVEREVMPAPDDSARRGRGEALDPRPAGPNGQAMPF